ncbi:type IV pilin protein [Agarivorans sp. Alg241-V36]|uniref:type IV pilin protein n=1 Tax=Agarivorans sp. Alg241-V36 TaxID=2305992 RepID=UPI0013D84ECD|nr:type IV pilin protein [Agarivorans sp. Alg241-V36]
MNKFKGFTLIEVMIVVAIIAILASIAYPSYLQHVQSTRREEAKRTLMAAAQHMESYYAMHLNYSGAVSGGSPTHFTPKSEFSDYYDLSATGMSKSTYKLVAKVKSGSGQASDSCQEFSIDSKGITAASNGECW